jgi:serine/threonine-protein kinase
MAFSAEIVNRARSRLGSVLNGKWRLDEVLGVGGMATVYAAMHRNQKRVAVKMLHTELSIDESMRNRFLREGYLANTVDHPGAVTIFDDDVAEDGSAFLVMELLEGETVHERLQREGVLPVSDVLSIGEQILDVLIAAHQKGIIHRDLKPENLFITPDGQVKVLDFGIARLRELPVGSGGTTATGFFMGTPAFMAPEHARGKWSEVDAQSDLFSVGATLYTLLTGQFVHESETAMDTLVLAVTKPANPIRDVRSDIPVAVAEVIDKALAYRKEDRWQSAMMMQAALHSVFLTLAPHEVVVRGSQRSPPDQGDPPASPAGVVNATVRSARSPVFTPRSARARPRVLGAPFPTPAEKTVPPDAPTAQLVSDPAGRSTPIDYKSTDGLSVTSYGKKTNNRKGLVSAFVAVMSLAVLVGVIVSRKRSGDAAHSTTDEPVSGPGTEVLVQPTTPVLPPTPVDLALPTATGVAPSIQAAALAESAPRETAAPPVRPSPNASARSANTRSAPPRTPALGAQEPKAASSTVAPAPVLTVPTGTNANPFDRRF